MLIYISVGIPIKVKNVGNKTEKDDALDLFLYLNEVG